MMFLLPTGQSHFNSFNWYGFPLALDFSKNIGKGKPLIFLLSIPLVGRHHFLENYPFFQLEKVLMFSQEEN